MQLCLTRYDPDRHRRVPMRAVRTHLTAVLSAAFAALFIACGAPDADPSTVPNEEARTPMPLLGSHAIATARANYQNASPNVVVSGIPGGWFENLTVQKGTTVVWINEDVNYHSVTAYEYDSGSLHIGDSFSRTFDQVGTSRFVCLYHSSMRATVTVVDS